jgi:uncharacterized OB-fold protein
MERKTYEKPLPRIDDLNRPFWDHARQGKLAVQHCRDCGHLHFPPAPSCPECLGTDQDWQPVSGRAELISYVDFHHAYWEAVKPDLPYRVCLVRLQEGPLLITNLAGDGNDVAIGSALQVAFDQVTPEITLPRFKQLATAGG